MNVSISAVITPHLNNIHHTSVCATPCADKYCGDAVCTPAINILEDMGVLKQLMDNNEAHFADAGRWFGHLSICLGCL